MRYALVEATLEQEPAGAYPWAMSLSKPSRTIVVEPVRAAAAVPVPPLAAAEPPPPREERPAEVPARP
jgi:hypothetical protein